MFRNAHKFNQDISNWDICKVTDSYQIITCTTLSDKLNGESCFNKKVMKNLFSYKRRKNFLMFLVKSEYIPYQEICSSNSYHKIFSKEDIYRTIMSYV